MTMQKLLVLMAIALLAVPASASQQQQAAKPDNVWLADQLQCPLDPDRPWGNTGSEPHGIFAHSTMEPPEIILRVEPVIADPEAPDPDSVPVILMLMVNRDGRVERIDRLRGSGPALSASVEAVKRWRFKPAILEGRAVCVLQIRVLLKDLKQDGTGSGPEGAGPAPAAKVPNDHSQGPSQPCGGAQ